MPAVANLKAGFALCLPGVTFMPDIKIDLRQCCPIKGKVCHPTRGEARTALGVIQRRNRSYVGITFWCDWCSSWHVGRRPWHGQRRR